MQTFYKVRIDLDHRWSAELPEFVRQLRKQSNTWVARGKSSVRSSTEGLRAYAGKFVELYMLENKDTLVVRSLMEVNGTEIPGMQVRKCKSLIYKLLAMC